MVREGTRKKHAARPKHIHTDKEKDKLWKNNHMREAEQRETQGMRETQILTITLTWNLTKLPTEGNQEF